MSDILDDLARYEADPPEPALMLDPSGRICGESQWMPAGLDRIGATGVGCVAHFPGLVPWCDNCIVRGDVRWRETTMEAHERQRGQS